MSGCGDVERLLGHLLAAIRDKRVGDIVGCYAPSAGTYVFLEGPRSSTLGIDRIATGWRAFVEAPLEVSPWRWVEGPFGEAGEEMAWLAGVLELEVRARGKTRRVRLRSSYVLRRGEDGDWRIVHEHVSQPAEDPYGIGDWLPVSSRRGSEANEEARS